MMDWGEKQINTKVYEPSCALRVQWISAKISLYRQEIE